MDGQPSAVIDRDDLIADMKRVHKPGDFKDLGPVDISKLVALVSKWGPDLWRSEDKIKENKDDVFHHTQHVIFRFTPKNADPRICYSNPIWDMCEPYLLPVMDAVTRPYGHGEIAYSKVMLARLRAGQAIDPHKDGNGSNIVSHKVHVPLITNPDAIFYVNRKALHLKAGYAYEVNNIDIHGADNRGGEDRIHLIFEHYDAAINPKRRNSKSLPV